MKLPRRTFLHLAAGAVALPAVSRLAWAQTYPSRPVRITVPVTPGGPQDIMARLIGQWLSERLGQPFIIDNRPGGGTNIGTEAVARAAPDGYTLLMVSPPNAVNATLYDKLNFNFLRDIVPVGGLVRILNAVVVHPSVPATTIPEFIAYAKSNPGKINMASAGIGTNPHVTGELFNMMAGTRMVHVPYRGAAPAFTDLLSGQVQVYFGSMAGALEHIKLRKLRALATTGATRSEMLPDIPAVSEYLPGFESSFWNGIGAPKNIPVAIIDRLNGEINAGLADPQFKARLADMGGTMLAGTPAEFGELIAAETEKWAKVIKFAGIRPD